MGWSFSPEKPERLSIVRVMIGEGSYAHEKFDFLGYTFGPRRSKNRAGKHFINFSPAVSDKAVKKMPTRMRGWNMPLAQ